MAKNVLGKQEFYEVSLHSSSERISTGKGQFDFCCLTSEFSVTFSVYKLHRL